MHYKIWKLKEDNLKVESEPESEESELNLNDDELNITRPHSKPQSKLSKTSKEESSKSKDINDLPDLVFKSTGRRIDNIMVDVSLKSNIFQSVDKNVKGSIQSNQYNLGDHHQIKIEN